MADGALHVVHVLDSLQVGGTENGVVNLVTTLSGAWRHSVAAFSTGGPLDRRLPAGVPVHVIGKRPGIDLMAIGRLALLLRRLAPDIVHSRNWGTLDAVLAARLGGVRTVIHGEHGREASDPQGLNPRRNRVRRLVSPLIDRFVTVSFDLQRWLVETIGLPARKIVTIHNGVDTGRFSDEGRAAGRRALGLGPDVVVVGTVGRLDPVKDQQGLLEALAALGGSSTPHTLVIVGDGPCRGALETRARQSDLAGRVHLLGERQDIPLLLKGFDVYALPSIAEGISNTILEAMATGLPVVATRTGGNPELVEDGVTGTLVPVGDRPALADALGKYLGDPHLRAVHGKAGRQRAVEAFSLGRMAAGYGDLYRELAGRRRKAPAEGVAR